MLQLPDRLGNDQSKPITSSTESQRSPCPLDTTNPATHNPWLSTLCPSALCTPCSPSWCAVSSSPRPWTHVTNNCSQSHLSSVAWSAVPITAGQRTLLQQHSGEKAMKTPRPLFLQENLNSYFKHFNCKPSFLP